MTADHFIIQAAAELEAFLKAHPCLRQPSSKTQKKYRAVMRTRRARGLIDPMATVDGAPPAKNSCYFNRAALIFCCREAFTEWLVRINTDAEGAPYEWLEEEARFLLGELRLLMEMAPPGDRIDEHQSRSRAGAQTNHSLAIFKPKTSKKIGLSSLGRNWQKKFWEKVNPKAKYAAHIAICLLVGPRPEEFQHGIEISNPLGKLRLVIKGAKGSDTTGIERRELEVEPTSAPAKFLLDLIQADGGKSIIFTCKANALNAAVSAVGDRAFPHHKYKVSPYSFRHALGGDLKQSGADRVDVAGTLGHCSTSTSGTYGYTTPAKGKKRVAPVKVVSVSKAIRVTHNPPPSWPAIRSTSQPSSRHRKSRGP